MVVSLTAEFPFITMFCFGSPSTDCDSKHLERKDMEQGAKIFSSCNKILLLTEVSGNIKQKQVLRKTYHHELSSSALFFWGGGGGEGWRGHGWCIG